MGLLEGKTALVTGGSAGIGLASAMRLTAEGAHVFITGRRKTEFAAAAERIGPGVTTVAGDVSDLSDLDRLYDAVRHRGHGLDVLFANVSVASWMPLEQVTEEHRGPRRLRGDQGRHPVVRPHLGQRTQGPRNPGQRGRAASSPDRTCTSTAD